MAILRELGLSDYERRTYHGLLEKAPATAQETAEQADVPEGRIYNVFRNVERHAPDDAMFASNTSTVPITELAEVTARPAQICGMHFFNSPLRIPLVEVIAGEHTSEETLALAESLTESFDKTPNARC
jgi:enoyl-CoA hydratase/3-hydroxyacyl-CoA dehydrogenase